MHEDYDTAFLEIARIAGLIWLASIVLRAMVTVGLQERALGRAQGPAVFYFSLGAAVWRMIGASILMFLLLILILVLLAVATGVFWYVAVTFIPHAGMAVAIIAVIAAVCWYIYAVVRFSFFLPAVVVAENQIGIGRSWELGGGNFWRIFAVIFVALVPVSIGLAIVQNAVVGPMMMAGFTPPKIHPGMNLHDILEFYAAIAKPMLQQFHNAWPFLIVFAVIREVVLLGLVNGAIGKAYLAVTEGHDM